MVEPVQICFAEPELARLLEDTGMHAVIRAAIDQRVLRLLIDAPQRDSEKLAQLAKLGIHVEAAANPESCDYIVQVPENDGGSVGQATVIPFDTFRQYVRKMI